MNPHIGGIHQCKTKMLTRHWYNRDAVGEAIYMVAGAWRDPLRKPKLLFWTYELVLSEEWEFLWGILDRVARRWGNQACLKAARSMNSEAVLHFLQLLLALPTPAPYDPPAAETTTATTTVTTTVTTTKVTTDATLQHDIPDVPTSWTVGQRKRLWLAVQNAILHRRSLRILRLLGNLTSHCAAKYLGVQTTGEKSLYSMLEMKGIPVLPTQNGIVSWPILPIGRIAARLFSLPRSLVSTGAIDPLDTKKGCAFWRRMWEAVKTEEDEEIFWNTYFVDDIPDEWSSAELSKSHILGH